MTNKLMLSQVRLVYEYLCDEATRCKNGSAPLSLLSHQHVLETARNGLFMIVRATLGEGYDEPKPEEPAEVHHNDDGSTDKEQKIVCNLDADQANVRAPLPDDATPIERIFPHVNKCAERIADVMLGEGEIEDKVNKLRGLLVGLCVIAMTSASGKKETEK